MPSAERLTAPVTDHGEGPFWDAPNQRILVMDVLNAEIVAVGSSQVVTRYKVPSLVATVIRRRASGGFMIATEHELIAADETLLSFQPFAHLLEDPSCRTNDGGCDPLGGFVVGTMAYDERPGAGAVYRIHPDGHVDELLSPVSISNGVQWAANGSRAFYIDSPTRRVDVFDVDPLTGSWSGRRPHIAFSDEPGFPDGMAIDEEDGLWVAMWGGGAVHHYDTSGRLVETITVPGVTQVSSCTFGGDQRDLLYITTSRLGLPDDREPPAGAVFVAGTRSRGSVPAVFAG
jgi:sugar lactone lactonase YvrE